MQRVSALLELGALWGTFSLVCYLPEQSPALMKTSLYKHQSWLSISAIAFLTSLLPLTCATKLLCISAMRRINLRVLKLKFRTLLFTAHVCRAFCTRR